jgi:hypothetical protein
MLLKILHPLFKKFCNRLECLSLTGISSLVERLWGGLGDYPRVEHLIGASLGQALPLPPNIRLDKAEKICRGQTILNYRHKKTSSLAQDT